MKRSSSTVMSAPTDIDNGKHYVLMSSDLEGVIALEEKRAASLESWQATVAAFDQQMILSISSIEDDGDGYILCLQIEGAMGFFTQLLVDSAKFITTIIGSSFNSKVVKLESGRAYLRLLR